MDVLFISDSTVVCSGMVLYFGALLGIKTCLDKKYCRLWCSFPLRVYSVVWSIFCNCLGSVTLICH